MQFAMKIACLILLPGFLGETSARVMTSPDILNPIR